MMMLIVKPSAGPREAAEEEKRSNLVLHLKNRHGTPPPDRRWDPEVRLTDLTGMKKIEPQSNEQEAVAVAVVAQVLKQWLLVIPPRLGFVASRVEKTHQEDHVQERRHQEEAAMKNQASVGQAEPLNLVQQQQPPLVIGAEPTPVAEAIVKEVSTLLLTELQFKSTKMERLWLRLH